MKTIHLKYPNRKLNGTLALSGSKSISNRLLMLQKLAAQEIDIINLSDSQDTQILNQILTKDAESYDAYHAGTSFRFATAYFSIQQGVQFITGSEQLRKRPIAPLVTALNNLGADISYIEKEGFAPIKIGSFTKQDKRRISIAGDVSSQHISALCMLAPVLPKGLIIDIKGQLVSQPYLQMTLAMMENFGIHYNWEDSIIEIAPQAYHLPKQYIVESDWSSASYYYAMISLVEKGRLKIKHLSEKSTQADQVIVELARHFNVKSYFEDNEVTLVKEGNKSINDFSYDFISCPDLAQTVAVMCAGLGVHANLSGLQTLRIKETDRISALAKELAKTGIDVAETPNGLELKGKTEKYSEEFESYQDHRMVMCLACLSVLGEVQIKNPEVVTKSYPNFWKDLQALGFIINV